MIRVLRACSIVGGLLLAASDGRAAPAARSSERPARSTPSLDSADPAVRREAIGKLVASRDPTAVAQLSLALDGDDDEGVRHAAASGLAELADRRGLGALRRCVKTEPSPAVKRSCRVSLGRLDPEGVTADAEPTGAAVVPAPGFAASGAAASAASAGASPPGVASPPGAPAAGPQLDLRIQVTPQDAAERPNHVYLELWSAIDKNTLALGFERVMGPRWSVALEPQFSAESQSFNGAKASAFSVSLALRPHFYFMQQAPSGPYVAPFAAIGYYRATFDFPPEFPDGDEKVSGTVWSVGAGVGWSLAVNARAVFKLSAVFAYSRSAATFGMSGVDQSASSAAFSPFASAGVMF